MAKSYFNCADCGADVRIAGRNRSDADRLAKWHKVEGHICDECAAKHRSIENAAAAAANQAAGLSALTGSEKQVAWAETIRRERLSRIDKAMPFLGEENASQKIALAHPTEYVLIAHHVTLLQDMMDGPLGIEAVKAFIHVLRRQSSARWWIDTRDTVYIEMARTIEAELRAELMPPAPPSEVQKEAEAEALLRPAGEPASAQIAEIRYVAPLLRVAFAEKNEVFRLAMRGMGFHWAERHWERTLDFRAGNPVDRMAETAHRLIGNGFLVRLHDDEARAKAISGQFEREQTRWICVAKGGGTYDGWCKITWAKSDDLYAPAKRLLGARYKDGAIFVPPGSIEEIAEFAEQYNFAMSETPRKILADHRTALARGVVISDTKRAPIPLRVEETGKPPKLTAPAAEIDNALKDA